VVLPQNKEESLNKEHQEGKMERLWQAIVK